MVLMLVLPVCAPAAEDTIKIGATEPLSGTFKDIGERYYGGVEYAVKVLNESGGLLGKKLEAVPIDSELKPDVAIRKATNLMLKDGVKFFCGGTGSSVGAAMAVLAEKNNAIMISYGMAAASLTGKDCRKNFFRVALSTDQHSYALAVWVAKQGYKNVATIAQDYSFGKEATEAFIRKLKKLNPSVKIVAELYHKIGEKDYAPYVSQLLSAKPDVIFTPNWGNDLTILLKQSNSFGLKTKFACYDLYDENVVKGVADDDYIVGNATSESYMLEIPGAQNKKFVEAFYKDKGYYPTWLHGKGYTAVMFLAEAIKKAGTTDVDAVIKAWEGLTYESIAGKYYMRPCDHQAQTPVYVTIMGKGSKFFKHAWGGTPIVIPAEEIADTCEENGCKMQK